MTSTEHLYRRSDDAASDLAMLDRHVALAKEACRAAIEKLEAATRDRARLRIQDADGRCFTAILEAIDDLASDKRKAISLRLEEADIAISDAERAA